MLIHTNHCKWFDVNGRYVCPCGSLINLRSHKERLANTMWKLLSRVGVVRSNRYPVEPPSVPLSCPDSIRSRTVPGNAFDVQNSWELPTHCGWPEPRINCAELKGTSLLELDAQAGISELPSSPRHSAYPVDHKASRHSSFSFQNSFTDIQETNLLTERVETGNSRTCVSAKNTAQLPSRDHVPYCSPTHENPHYPSQNRKTTPNDLDLGDRQGSSSDSVLSYPPKTAPVWSTPTTSQGSHDDSNASQLLKDVTPGDFVAQSHLTGLETMLECEESFGQETQPNSEESFDATNHCMNDFIQEEMWQMPYTEEEIGFGTSVDDVLDHSPPNPIDDKTCGLEHGQSCFTSSTSRLLSRYWKTSQQLIDAFETAHSIFLKDIQLKLPGIDEAKSVPQLKSMSSDPAACLERGLDVFREILKEGKKPDTIEDIFAFLITVYASAAILHNDLTTLNMRMWFQETLCWVGGISDLPHQELYLRVIAGIWQAMFGASVPPTVEEPREAASFSIKENNCVKMLQNLLDGMA
jgi:hypothetical protein